MASSVYVSVHNDKWGIISPNKTFDPVDGIAPVLYWENSRDLLSGLRSLAAFIGPSSKGQG
jgi:hypothetical protein